MHFNFLKSASTVPLWDVKTVRPSLSTMGWGLYRITFDDAQAPHGKRPKGGTIILPAVFFMDQVSDAVARALGDYKPILECEWVVGHFFTGCYGRAVGGEPEYSSRSACIRMDLNGRKLQEIACRVAHLISAPVLVVPWNSIGFNVVMIGTIL